jgi:hypothetical protein
MHLLKTKTAENFKNGIESCNILDVLIIAAQYAEQEFMDKENLVFFVKNTIPEGEIVGVKIRHTNFLDNDFYLLDIKKEETICFGDFVECMAFFSSFH